MENNITNPVNHTQSHLVMAYAHPKKLQFSFAFSYFYENSKNEITYYRAVCSDAILTSISNKTLPCLT